MLITERNFSASFNSDRVDADMDQVCKDVFTDNEFSRLEKMRLPVQIWDFTEGSERILWGNNEMLEMFGLTLEQLIFDPIHESSDSLAEWHRHVHKIVQVENKTYAATKTRPVGGKMRTLFYSCFPIRVDFRSSGEVKVMILSVTIPLSSKQQDPQELRQLALNRRFSEIRILVEKEDGAMLSCSTPACEHYAAYAQGDSALDLRTILGSFDWDGRESRNEVWKRLHHRKDVQFEGKKRLGPLTWHRVTCTHTKDPVTSKQAILISEVSTVPLCA